jgi:hypothetical protein
MLIYEVNIEVDQEINFKCAGWLPEQIKKILTLKGFQGAYWYFRDPKDEGREPSGKTLWTVHYLVENRQCLDEYLNQHKPAEKQEILERFGSGFAASQRVLQLLSVAGSPQEDGEAGPA